MTHPGDDTGLAATDIRLSRGGAPVLRDVACTVTPGEVVGLVGPNGAGKTSLLRVLAGLAVPDAGTVTLRGRPLRAVDRRRLAAELAYLPHGRRPQWPVPVRDVVALGRAPHRRAWRGWTAADRRAVADALDATGTAHLAHRPASRLSAGECARVLLARALAGEPAWLLADEPVAGLDPYHRLEVMTHVRRLAARDRAVAVVLHDLSLAARFCDRLVLLDRGAVVTHGAPGEVLTPARLRDVYGVVALTGERDGEPVVLPWARADAG